MTMTDPIADMLTRLRNANTAYHDVVVMPHSKIKAGIAEILKQEGYIAGWRTEQQGTKSKLVVTLKYHQGRPVIERIERVSRPGLRIYKGHGEIPQVLNGLGVAIVTTSRGVMTDRRARATGVGGEVIAYVA